jgi:hypothetical protein
LESFFATPVHGTNHAKQAHYLFQELLQTQQFLLIARLSFFKINFSVETSRTSYTINTHALVQFLSFEHLVPFDSQQSQPQMIHPSSSLPSVEYIAPWSKQQ